MPGKDDIDQVRGGVCPSENAVVIHGIRPHVSTGPDTDVSLRVAVHICDYCQALFVPDPT